jgi:hypothetical protein
MEKKAEKTARLSQKLPPEVADLQNELLTTVLKKTGVDYDFLIETAKKEFVASNLDVLDKTELKKFQKILR